MENQESGIFQSLFFHFSNFFNTPNILKLPKIIQKSVFIFPSN